MHMLVYIKNNRDNITAQFFEKQLPIKKTTGENITQQQKTSGQKSYSFKRVLQCYRPMK